MSKTTMLVTKSGCVFRPRAALSGASMTGEQGETEGILRHLAARDDVDVVYYGAWAKGAPYDAIPGVTVVDATLVDSQGEPFNEHTSLNEQQLAVEHDMEALAEVAESRPVAMIEVCGLSPTMCLGDNPNYAQTQASGIRYYGPQMLMLARLDVPRLCVNNDPRTYPKNQEMSLCRSRGPLRATSTRWRLNGERMQPRAMLDQCERTTLNVTGGVQFERRSVYAACESWGHLERHENTGELPCVVLAHAHVKTGTRGGDTVGNVWRELTGGIPGAPVYGEGWDHVGGPGLNWQGRLRPVDVPATLARATCCPVVSHTPGFYTGKPYVLEASGCIPILYGDGDPTTTGNLAKHTADPMGLLQSLGSCYRVTSGTGLARIVGYLRDSADMRADMRASWHAVTRPRWSLLDRMVDELLARGSEAPERTGWHETYGGYRLALKGLR